MSVCGRIRVLYGDTDQMGQAYYGNYLKWFETGRNEWFRQMGMSYRRIEEEGYYLPVIEVYCRYFKPAYYDDLLCIDTSASLPSPAKLKFTYRIYRENSGEIEDDKIAEGYTVHVFLNSNKRPTKPPVFLRDMVYKNERGDSL
ncbi:MAG: acyl-CoA thioesterase [Syntrophobacterales bacterium]|nr:acyl-CoA thioesterase [Syntrophobacterales bacterium]